MTNRGGMQSLTREAVREFAGAYKAIRDDVGLTDCGDWVKLKVSGYEARDFLDRVLTGNLQQLGENEILHTMALDAAGKFLCDVMVLGGFEDFILLCPDAQAEKIQAALNAGEGEEFEIADQTQDYCLIRADGPNCADLPMAILGGAVSGLRIMAFAEAELEGFTITAVSAPPASMVFSFWPRLNARKSFSPPFGQKRPRHRTVPRSCTTCCNLKHGDLAPPETSRTESIHWKPDCIGWWIFTSRSLPGATAFLRQRTKSSNRWSASGCMTNPMCRGRGRKFRTKTAIVLVMWPGPVGRRNWKRPFA